MLTLLGSPRLCCDGRTRRETLKVGALSLLGGFLNLPSLLVLEKQRAAPTRAGRAKSVILLYLQGGPPTQDMFDLKPDAPSGIRSELKPIPASANGVQVCELLPQMARWMHKACVVRSVYHKGGCHNNLPMYTSYDVPPPDIDSARATDPPSMGSVLTYHDQVIRGKKPGVVPPYIYLPCPLGWGEYKKKPGPHGGFLGQRFDPLTTECTAYVDHPPDKQWYPQPLRGEPVLSGVQLPKGMTIDALSSRRTLLEQMEEQVRKAESQPAKRGFTRNQELAFHLLTSSQIRKAFDLRQETDRLRERYGRTLFGATSLLARRLVERGARFVNVSWDNFSNRFQVSNEVWDTHERNYPVLRGTHLPSLDQTYSALMEDLDQRGLLDETLIVMMGEMGRTPNINDKGGRDHWTFCYSVLFAGAGIRGGTVYGASDKHAAYIKDKPVRINDICATIYHCLGIDPEMTVQDQGGRPIPVAHGGKPLYDILV
jgi:hypothetical protein